LATPSSSPQRIAAVDVLRAFALFGIIVTHAGTGYLSGKSPTPDFLVFNKLDRLVREFEDLFTIGKFFTIFAFLFGLSFSIQLDNAKRAGTAFAARFAWRLSILFAIGLVHHLFFGSDVLTLYALLGLPLIAIRTARTEVLVVVAVALVLNLPGLALNLRDHSTLPQDIPQEQAAAQAQANEQRARRAQRQYEIKRTGSVADVVRLNVTESFGEQAAFLVTSGRLCVTFGLLLLGLCAGRVNLFRDDARNRLLFKRILIAAGIVGALSTCVIVAPTRLSASATLESFAASIQRFSMATLYASVVTLLFWRAPSGPLSALAPMGKMGLTTYLTQSAFGLVVFYGFGLGLLGKLGVASCVALAIAFYLLQVAVCRWWLQRFSMGPVEWLWRSLTDLKIRPLQRPPAARAAS
jgi:uncharacterized protein